MEKRISKGVLSAALVLVTSFVCGIIAIVGFVLGDFQAVLYSAILEMCGLFIICVMIDAIQQQMRTSTKCSQIPLGDVQAVLVLTKLKLEL